MSAVTYSADKVEGEYYKNIPDDFSAGKFMEFVKNRIPETYYEALKKYSLEIQPKGKYYLLIATNPENNAMILFDYSCTTALDGPVWREPDKYELDNLEKYDPCERLSN